jgi:hypothetical protein
MKKPIDWQKLESELRKLYDGTTGSDTGRSQGDGGVRDTEERHGSRSDPGADRWHQADIDIFHGGLR